MLSRTPPRLVSNRRQRRGTKPVHAIGLGQECKKDGEGQRPCPSSVRPLKRIACGIVILNKVKDLLFSFTQSNCGRPTLRFRALFVTLIVSEWATIRSEPSKTRLILCQ